VFEADGLLDVVVSRITCGPVPPLVLSSVEGVLAAIQSDLDC
jgi:hypothetical protein